MVFERRGYLLEVTSRTPLLRTFRDLVDVLARYRYNEFFVLRRVDPEEENIDWKKLSLYCEMQGIDFVRLDADSWERLFCGGETITVDTCSGKSLAGRVEEMRERMIVAEEQGRVKKLKRFLVTDISDGYEWHPPIISLPAIVMGGNFASSGPRSANMDLERELNSVLDAPIAGLLLKLGTLYLRGGAHRDGESEYFNILAGDCGYSRHPGITQTVLDEVSGIVRGVRIAAERWVDRNDRAKEIVYAANLLDAACHRRNETMLRELRDEHGRIWRASFAADGRVESLARLPRF